MNLIVFGAAGRAGRAVVERALAQGYSVTAFVRHASKFHLDNPNLRVVHGDARNFDQVAAAMAGQEAVVNALSTGTLEPTTALSDNTRNIIRAMEQQGIKRLVTLFASAMVTGKVNPQYANINVEHKRVLKLLQESGLDWVAVAPPTIADEPRTGHYRIAVNALPQPSTMRISKYDLADFILSQLTDNAGLHQIIGVVE